MNHAKKLTFAKLPSNASTISGGWIFIGEETFLKNKTFLSILNEAPEDCFYLTHNGALVLKATIPSEKSRNTGPIRVDSIFETITKNFSNFNSTKRPFNTLNISVYCSQEQVFPTAFAISRAFPLYNRKTVSEGKESPVTNISVFFPPELNVDYQLLENQCDAVRQCARLVDTPTCELHTDAYVEEIRQMVKNKIPGVKMEVIHGKSLEEKGFGGIWGVGKAAPHLPALVILSHTPSDAKFTSCWVGKGIVYDSGGLSIKVGGNMCGMKMDMGGSAAILCAFVSAVSSGYNQNLHAILCLAENSVDANSQRNDDIIQMYSGKTVEINNTDAEGRLVLSDGVAYASKHLNPNIIVDMATLTGAQLISTGTKHAAIQSNSERIENLAKLAGQQSGDWVFPMLYAPEILKKEFSSEVADMKNSVKNRMNAQSSCAGHFIEDHLVNYKGDWLHVDIAGPSENNGRATGFGVAFLLEFLKKISE